MRKIITGLMGTISGVALLFSYHTSTATQAATVAATATATEDSQSAATTPNAAESQGSSSRHGAHKARAESLGSSHNKQVCLFFNQM